MYNTLLLMGVTLFASLVGTISGFGISTIMIPILVSYYSLPEVLFFVAFIHLANDVWKLLLFHEGIRWRILFYFGAAGFVLSIVGALIAIRVGITPVFVQIFGAFLILYALFMALRPHFVVKETVPSLIASGGVSGFLFGLFGMGGLVRSTALISFNMDKAIYLATNGAIALLVDVARVIVYGASGIMLGKELLIGVALCIPLSFFGAKLGEKIVRFVSQRQFRLIVIGFVVLMGIKLVLKI